LLVSAVPARGQGHFEFGFHYGSWSLNLLKSTFEGLAESIAEQFKNQQFDKIQADNPDANLRELDFQTTSVFDSSGKDFGFDIRWYPAGETGSFSIGLAVEKMTMKIGIPSSTTAMTIEDMNTGKIIHFDGAASGEVKSTPMVFLLNFRWDIFPRGVIHPYFTFGFGAAGVSALDETIMAYDISGTVDFPGKPAQTIAETGSKTLLELKAEDAQRKLEKGKGEEPFDYPIKFFPFVQLHFGLKAKLAKFAHLMVDFGVLDGFVLRGGLAIRL
ncbi:MAG: hypothetical protein NTZ26_08695, partial [Candidatus Aminicenantes bacterium]|nr:hypothetical protein [Candidatus Aminicenantes bacterium]